MNHRRYKETPLGKLLRWVRFLEDKKKRTEEEEKALKGLKRSLICKFFVAIAFCAAIIWSARLFCMATDHDDGGYLVETSYVRNGQIKYGNKDTWYDVSPMGYEEGTWLYLYIDPDTKQLDHTRPMNEVKEEQGARETEFLTRALVIFGAGMVVLILGLVIALAVFERPFRKWIKKYRGNIL